MVGGETLLMTLTTGILGYVSQKKMRISTYFAQSSGQVLTCMVQYTITWKRLIGFHW